MFYNKCGLGIRYLTDGLGLCMGHLMFLLLFFSPLFAFYCYCLVCLLSLIPPFAITKAENKIERWHFVGIHPRVEDSVMVMKIISTGIMIRQFGFILLFYVSKTIPTNSKNSSSVLQGLGHRCM